MKQRAAETMDRLVSAHGAMKTEQLERLRSLSLVERGALIAAAREAAAIIQRSRAAAGLPPSTPAPWPASTREFMKRHAARVRA